MRLEFSFIHLVRLGFWLALTMAVNTAARADIGRLDRESGPTKAYIWHPRIKLINQQKAWKTFPDEVEIMPSGDVT